MAGSQEAAKKEDNVACWGKKHETLELTAQGKRGAQ